MRLQAQWLSFIPLYKESYLLFLKYEVHIIKPIPLLGRILYYKN